MIKLEDIFAVDHGVNIEARPGPCSGSISEFSIRYTIVGCVRSESEVELMTLDSGDTIEWHGTVMQFAGRLLVGKGDCGLMSAQVFLQQHIKIEIGGSTHALNHLTRAYREAQTWLYSVAKGNVDDDAVENEETKTREDVPDGDVVDFYIEKMNRAVENEEYEQAEKYRQYAEEAAAGAVSLEELTGG